MNSTMSKQSAKVTDVFRQSKTQATRGKKAAVLAEPPQAAAAANTAGANAANAQDAADEAILRQFDLNGRYGPCIGITRLERWERATGLGLEPPEEVKTLVMQYGTASLYNKCVFAAEKPF